MALPTDFHLCLTLQLLRIDDGIRLFDTGMLSMKGNVLGKLGYMHGGPQEWITQAEMILKSPPQEVALVTGR